METDKSAIHATIDAAIDAVIDATIDATNDATEEENHKAWFCSLSTNSCIEDQTIKVFDKNEKKWLKFTIVKHPQEDSTSARIKEIVTISFSSIIPKQEIINRDS